MTNTTTETTSINQTLQPLLDTVDALRGPNGCPWDKKQTNSSLLKYLTSEYKELELAIKNKDQDNMCEELGDLLYIIIMYAEINRSSGSFALSDVIARINEKLIRRHPHVFAGQSYETEEELNEQWQAIKDTEKKK